MTAAGLGLNKFCYAGLIAAHKNKTPITDETTAKVSNINLYLLYSDSFLQIDVFLMVCPHGEDY